MSLAEIPSTNIRRNAQSVQTHYSPKQIRHPLTLQNGDDGYRSAQRLSPIQGMLKNTTEIGDEGQFSVKPSRVPVLASQRSPAASHAPRATTSKRHPYPLYNGYGGYSSGYSPESPRQGSLVTNGSGSLPRGHRRPHPRPSLEDYSSYSVTQNSYNNHSLTRRHPFNNGHHYVQGDANNVRPRSPFAYPTRLKRPGYRPSSPAFSDLSKSVAGHASSTRTASPLSAYNMNRTPSPFRYVVNRADPELQYYPPYLATEPSQRRTPSMASTHPSTPKRSQSAASLSDSSHVHQQRPIIGSRQEHPKASPVSPIFYDYSEGFEAESKARESSVVEMAHVEEQSLAVGTTAHSKWEDCNSTEFAEPSAERRSHKRSSQAHEPELNQGSCKIDSYRDDFPPSAPQDLSDVLELPETDNTTTGNEFLARVPSNPMTMNQVTLPFQDASALQSLNGTSEKLPSIESDQIESQKELATETTQLKRLEHSSQAPKSPTASLFSAKSSNPNDPPFLTPKPDQASLTPPINAIKLEVSKTDDEQLGTGTRTASTHPPESLRGPSFEGHSRISTEILSPTPERSVIAPSSRDRFSKILSIDEDQLHEQSLVPPTEAEHLEAPRWVINKIDSWDPNAVLVPFRRRRSLRALKSPLKQSIGDDVPAEASDSEDEPELTVGLRQTFCKDERSIAQLHKLASPPVSLYRSWDANTANHVGLEKSTAGSRPMKQPSEDASKQSSGVVQNQGEVGNLRSSATYATRGKVGIESNGLPAHILRKQPSFRSYSPPPKPRASQLPLDFTPLIRQVSNNDSCADHETVKSQPTEIEGIAPNSNKDVIQSLDTAQEARSNRSSQVSPHDSAGSRPTSRPWNQASSYPWNEEPPTLDVMMPQEGLNSGKRIEDPPRFKLNVQRASSSTEGANKLRKTLPRDNSRSPFASSLELGRGQTFRRKKDPSLTGLPGQLNSSHDIINSSRQRTRFVDTFETQSPTLSLFPPSPNHEARSFFSDDSSQTRPKGVLRKRLSGFKARAAAARAGSMEDARGYDRGLLGSALGRSRASGRSSRQSHQTGRTSTRRSVVSRMRWKIMDRLRLWLHRSGDKVRDWGWKKRYRSGKHRAESAPTHSSD